MATSEGYLIVGEGGDSVTCIQFSSLRLTLTCLLCMVALYNLFNSFYDFYNHSQMTKYNTIVTSGFIRSVCRHLITHAYALGWSTDFADQLGLSDTTYNKKWDAEKFTINARLKILTRLMLNRVNRCVNAINPAALFITQIHIYTVSQKSSQLETLCNFVKS